MGFCTGCCCNLYQVTSNTQYSICLFDIVFPTCFNLGTDHLISGGGGGWYFSSRKVIFSLYLHNKLFFFKSKQQQVFIFLAHLWCAYAMALCLSWIVRSEVDCVCVEHNNPKMCMDLIQIWCMYLSLFVLVPPKFW